MKSKESQTVIDPTTEEKIRIAARKVFTQKGYGAARTRDIAQEAGINIALLNYYFRSKEKLFEIIMLESMQGFIHSISGVLNDEQTSLQEKIQILVSNYIDMLTIQPNLPLFVLSELRSNPQELILKLNFKEKLIHSHFFVQLQQAIQEGKIPPIHPLHFIMNIMGMIIFPFIGSPILKNIGDLEEKTFNELMQQRKILIPKWIEAMMNVK
ncbi:MAG: TetR/AcrR family transcriptional regulator [Saprospiraceae bacterium]|uniref:TetR/AcrR family transcriptional regulator n=1 Tax=Candidatus Opimibacter skivensis TaxID=2982028 RepID=A0A9D7XRA1_9BACT|nr:TetR/AcrR family transcriptional regulator [Candidatus Opimibacter skivensis]